MDPVILLPSSLASLLLLAFATSGYAEPQDAAPPPPGTIRSTLRIQRVIVRVPTAAVSTAGAPVRALPPINWVERRADRCVPMSSLASAAITRPDSVDLTLTGGRRLRARLGDDCPALDFYQGFYLRPTSDGMVCASRDSIRSRSGGQCRIEGFRALVPGR